MHYRLRQAIRNPITAADRYGSYIILKQAPTPHWKLESELRFKVSEPDVIDFSMKFIPRENTFAYNWFGVFFASYIHHPEDPRFYFIGCKEGESLEDLRWMAPETPKHGVNAIYRNFQYPDFKKYTFHKDFPKKYLIALGSLSDCLYFAPFFFGKIGKYALVLMFSPHENLYLTRSPSGGGEGNPAWDWQYRWKDVEINREYKFSGRMIFRPYSSRSEIVKMYLEWPLADKGISDLLRERFIEE